MSQCMIRIIVNAIYIYIRRKVFMILVFYGGHLTCLKIHTAICGNVNIAFRALGIITFPKLYWFPNLHKV